MTVTAIVIVGSESGIAGVSLGLVYSKVSETSIVYGWETLSPHPG